MMIDWTAGLLLMILFGGVIGMVTSVVISSRWWVVEGMDRVYMLAVCLLVLAGFVIILPFLKVFGNS